MLIRVKVFPDALEEGFVKKSDTSFEIMVREKPIRGLANKAIMRVLGEIFNVPAGNIRLIKGFKERSKIFEIK